MKKEFKPNHGIGIAVLGAAWGDESKGKITAAIAEAYGMEEKDAYLWLRKLLKMGDEMMKFELICRFNGGANAGHTLITQKKKKIATHALPSGIIVPGTTNYISAGCVLNPYKIIEEINDIGKDVRGKLVISGQVQVVRPDHILLDLIGAAANGTTKNGIGPAYADRALRTEGDKKVDLSIGEVIGMGEQKANKIFLDILEYRAKLHGMGDDEKVQKMKEDVKDYVSAIFQLDNRFDISPNPNFLADEMEDGKNVLFEGAQSIPLGLGFGVSPYNTSSYTSPGVALANEGIRPEYLVETIGVTKAISSRVGKGPFPGAFGGIQTEAYCNNKDWGTVTKNSEIEKYGSRLEDNKIQELLRGNSFEVGIALRILANEYGASTGRPRSTGALDLVLLKQSIKKGGISQICLSHVDLLHLFERTLEGKVPVVVGYKDKDGNVRKYFPQNADQMYETVGNEVLEYWDAPHLEDMESVWGFAGKVSEGVGAPVNMVGVGPGGEDVCVRRG